VTAEWSSRLHGDLRDRLAAATAQLAADTPYTDDLVVQDVVWDPSFNRLFQDYRGDLSGRYLGAVAIAHREGLDPDLAKANRILDRILAAQALDGSFGPPVPALRLDHGAAWGHGRLLDGLLASAGWVRDERADALALSTRRLVDHVVASAPAWVRWMGGAKGAKFTLDPLSLVLPLARYARLHNHEPALSAACALSASAPADVTGLHLHGFLLHLRGRLAVSSAGADAANAGAAVPGAAVPDAAEATRASVLAVAEAADDVAARFILPTGSALESLSEPWDINTEGCGTADWVMLNLELHDATAEPRFLERAWLSAFNGLAHSQRDSGHFGCETIVGEGPLLASDYAPEAWWCCTFHGIEALGSLSRSLVGSHVGSRVGSHVIEGRPAGDSGITIGQPIAARYSCAGADAVEVTGDYPRDDTLVMHGRDGLPQGTRVRLRIPESVTLAAVESTGDSGWSVDGSLLTIVGLAAGEAVTIRLDPALWFLVDGTVMLPPFGNTTAPPPDLSERRVTVFRGQQALTADAVGNDPEDLIRARRIVHAPAQRELTTSTDGAVVIGAGFNEFSCELRLTPLASQNRARHARLVRAGFTGLLYEHEGEHV
jgi:hypothetical protein